MKLAWSYLFIVLIVSAVIGIYNIFESRSEASEAGKPYVSFTDKFLGHDLNEKIKLSAKAEIFFNQKNDYGVSKDGRYYISYELVNDTNKYIYLLLPDSTSKDVIFHGNEFKGRILKMERLGNYYFSSLQTNTH